MKKMIIPSLIVAAVILVAFRPGQKDNLKVFISVDMEGIAGVVSGKECGSSGHDYDYFRKLTTLETNAAIEGALEAGATEIVVRDGHGANCFVEGRTRAEEAVNENVTDRLGVLGLRRRRCLPTRTAEEIQLVPQRVLLHVGEDVNQPRASATPQKALDR